MINKTANTDLAKNYLVQNFPINYSDNFFNAFIEIKQKILIRENKNWGKLNFKQHTQMLTQSFDSITYNFKY